MGGIEGTSKGGGELECGNARTTETTVRMSLTKMSDFALRPNCVSNKGGKVKPMIVIKK